ncbi:hypothetical protein [Xanthomonas campestris]|uniref:hypothetical protein n=1 Tax=Xanthomonas campestris TaxID=339 RepID=UPI002006DEF4|nr:hypothetical protein [Xanthomonas campestris]
MNARLRCVAGQRAGNDFMRKAAYVALIPGLLLAFAGAARAALMASEQQQWRCSCDGADHWHDIGAEGSQKASRTSTPPDTPHRAIAPIAPRRSASA